MAAMSLREKLQRADYWTRSLATHEPAHIVTGRSRGAVVRYFLACNNSVTGGLNREYAAIRLQKAHVCVGCVNTVVTS